jgi:hypothetical protein
LPPLNTGIQFVAAFRPSSVSQIGDLLVVEKRDPAYHGRPGWWVQALFRKRRVLIFELTRPLLASILLGSTHIKRRRLFSAGSWWRWLKLYLRAESHSLSNSKCNKEPPARVRDVLHSSGKSFHGLGLDDYAYVSLSNYMIAVSL